MPNNTNAQGSTPDPITGPRKGDFISPPEQEEPATTLPNEEEHWRPPARFGSVPVEKAPLGWDPKRRFKKCFPPVLLPFQVVERVSFGHPQLKPNRLFWGDNLHIMRQLPNESIDLIYIDPPFFSGRHYNVIFGDKNELRSFSDIWEGGMPGYLIWLNARLFEMKRLLKKTGSIYVHCDWHASHYIKIEMDKIFGYQNFKNEIVWSYRTGGASKKQFSRKHDIILFYGNVGKHTFNILKEKAYTKSETRKPGVINYGGGTAEFFEDSVGVYNLVNMRDVWEISYVGSTHPERLGYPTQKPVGLLERIIKASSNEGDVVLDPFCGCGTTAAVAQRLGRHWITSDQSRVAVAVTADRLTRQVNEQIGPMLLSVPDFTIEHWGVYEGKRLSQAPPDQFRAFVLSCFGATIEERQTGIHGYKGAVPVFVGEPHQSTAVTSAEVTAFANAIRKTLGYQQDNLRDGIMLAWAFSSDAHEAARRLQKLEDVDLNFVRLDLIRIDSPRFREHVSALSTSHADYENFLTFVQPPIIEVGYRREAPRTYRFDVSDTAVMNSGAKIVNVQWDFRYNERFASTPGYSFAYTSKNGVKLQARYKFPADGERRIACKVQDDLGGEGLWVDKINVD